MLPCIMPFSADVLAGREFCALASGPIWLFTASTSVVNEGLVAVAAHLSLISFVNTRYTL